MGFNPRLAPYSLMEVAQHDPSGDEIFTLFRFPVAGRVIDAYATNTTGIASSGNMVGMFLLKYSSAGTPVLQGTLGSWAEGTTWVQDVPRQLTMTSVGSTAQFVAGEWLRLEYDITTSGVWTEMGFQFDYVLGYDV